MKELSIEEKAKAYDEVREKIAIRFGSNVADEIFSEYEESEDENIIKALIDEVSRWSEDTGFGRANIPRNNILAWLEKQGEQNPADKVEPKFHEGEWMCENEPNNYARFIQILEIVNIQGKERYRISRDIHNDEDTVEFGFVEKYYHKFDIQDAKDGDVLTCYSDIKGQPIEQTGIIKQYVGRHGGCSNSFKAHFGVDWDNNVVIEGYMGSSNIYPATKEQCDTLMKAMADAGWEFDFEKKELNKIKRD